MRKVSELIRLAVENPLYLGAQEHYAFLCNVVETMYTNGDISGDEYWQAKDHIHAALVDAGQGIAKPTLRLTLKRYHADFEADRENILYSVDLDSDRVKNYCRMFWAVLCMDLVRKGL